MKVLFEIISATLWLALRIPMSHQIPVSEKTMAMKILEERERDYYECLSFREKRLLHSGTKPAVAITASKHQRISLPCWQCIPPLDIVRRQRRRMIWAHQKLTPGAKLEKVPIGNEEEVNSNDREYVGGEYDEELEHDYLFGNIRNLIIQKADGEHRGKIVWQFYPPIRTIKFRNSFQTLDPKTQSGFYSCWDEKTKKLESLYYVDILPELPKRLAWKESNSTIKGLELLEAHSLGDTGLRVMSDWGFWSKCNRCGFGFGETKMGGDCTVKPENFTEFEDKQPSGLKESDWKHLVGLFHIFGMGLPCRSTLLPLSIREMKEVHARPDEIRVRACRRECPNEESTPRYKTRINAEGEEEIVDEIPPNHYTFDDPLPAILPPVRRFNSGTLRIGQRLAISCPDDLAGEKFWRFLNKSSGKSVRLGTWTARILFRGRMIIDADNTIHLSNATDTDSGIYSCLLWDKTLLLTAQVKVKRDSILYIVRAYVVAMCAGLMMVSVFALMIYQTFRLKWGSKEMREARKREEEEKAVQRKMEQSRVFQEEERRLRMLGFNPTDAEKPSFDKTQSSSEEKKKKKCTIS